jgi:hypothetical protein
MTRTTVRMRACVALWERAARAQSGATLDRDDRDELRVIARTREDARTGKLDAALSAHTDPFREALRAERARHMSIAQRQLHLPIDDNYTSPSSAPPERTG